MITSEETVEYEKKCYEFGIICYIRKPFYPDAIRQLVDNVIQVFQYKKQLEITVKGQTEKLKHQNAVLKVMAEKQKHTNEVLIESLSNIVEFRNLESEQHIKRNAGSNYLSYIDNFYSLHIKHKKITAQPSKS